MERKDEITKNLKHGYIFLSIVVLLVFTLSLGIEMYAKGGFHINENTEENEITATVESDSNENSDENVIKILNLEDGFKTTEEAISITGEVNGSYSVSISGEKVEIDVNKRFEKKVNLSIGENILTVIAFEGDKHIQELKLKVIREEIKKETPKENKVDSPPIKVEPAPTNKPNPVEQPKPTPEVKPTPNPTITGLKISCSITNTYPAVGQTVTVTCTAVDQDNKPIQGATGSINIPWSSGNQNYALSVSNGSGSMSASFQIPAGNSGLVTGKISVSKDGLTVNSNFNLNIK